MFRRAPWAALLVAVLWMNPARAGGNEVSGSVAYWTESSAAFSATLGKFRFPIATFYIEGQAGAWLFFSRDPIVRFHATGGGGVDLGVVRLGVEAGYLHNGGLFGARVSFSF